MKGELVQVHEVIVTVPFDGKKPPREAYAAVGRAVEAMIAVKARPLRTTVTSTALIVALHVHNLDEVDRARDAILRGIRGESAEEKPLN